MAARLAQGVYALHGETGQILHARSLRGQPDLRGQDERIAQAPWTASTELLERIVALTACSVKRKEYKVLWYGSAKESA